MAGILNCGWFFLGLFKPGSFYHSSSAYPTANSSVQDASLGARVMLSVGESVSFHFFFILVCTGLLCLFVFFVSFRFVALLLVCLHTLFLQFVLFISYAATAPSFVREASFCFTDSVVGLSVVSWCRRVLAP